MIDMSDGEKARFAQKNAELSRLAKEVMDAAQAIAEYYKSHSDEHGHPMITPKTVEEVEPLRERYRIADQNFQKQAQNLRQPHPV